MRRLAGAVQDLGDKISGIAESFKGLRQRLVQWETDHLTQAICIRGFLYSALVFPIHHRVYHRSVEQCAVLALSAGFSCAYCFSMDIKARSYLQRVGLDFDEIFSKKKPKRIEEVPYGIRGAVLKTEKWLEEHHKVIPSLIAGVITYFRQMNSPGLVEKYSHIRNFDEAYRLFAVIDLLWLHFYMLRMGFDFVGGILFSSPERTKLFLDEVRASSASGKNATVTSNPPTTREGALIAARKHFEGYRPDSACLFLKEGLRHRESPIEEVLSRTNSGQQNRVTHEIRCFLRQVHAFESGKCGIEPYSVGVLDFAYVLDGIGQRRKAIGEVLKLGELAQQRRLPDTLVLSAMVLDTFGETGIADRMYVEAWSMIVPPEALQTGNYAHLLKNVGGVSRAEVREISGY
ncbi:MAG: hypothetical protein V1659_05175 [Candidatus Woesearchaeota archaeon]